MATGKDPGVGPDGPPSTDHAVVVSLSPLLEKMTHGPSQMDHCRHQSGHSTCRLLKKVHKVTLLGRIDSCMFMITYSLTGVQGGGLGLVQTSNQFQLLPSTTSHRTVLVNKVGLQ